jgi:hypothetical protein
MKTTLYSLLLLGAINHAIAQTTTATPADSATMQQAWQYLKGINSPLDPTKALALYTQCANNGNAKAMNAVGMQYKLGIGVTANDTTAELWLTKAANAGYTKAWVNLGELYKHADPPNYEKAYNCYVQAASMGYSGGIYEQAYMNYKGLGCIQDYEKAYELFRSISYTGNIHAMYFLGILFRNGYGVTLNTDSARYWLAKSAALGEHQSRGELKFKSSENSFDTSSWVGKIKAIQAPGALPVNQYTKVPNHVAAADIPGNYTGYLVKYDWSGQHIINVSSLNVQLTNSNQSLTGVWTEDDSITLSLTATLTQDSILFSNMQYSRADHYHPKGLQHIFQNASLQSTRNGDTVYLAGNLHLFKPSDKEPGKPLYAVLSRIENNAYNINNLAPLQIYPNPFANTINVNFVLQNTATIYTELYTLSGKLVYKTPEQTLQAGSYTLPIQINVAAGTYIVKLYNGKQVQTATVVRQ